MLTKEIRNEYYNKSSASKKYFYSSSETGTKLLSIAQKYDLRHDDTYKKFAITVGDIILGFYRPEDTVPLLQQELKLDPRTAALLGADVLEFLAPLSDPNWKPPFEDTETQESISLEPNFQARPLQKIPTSSSIPVTVTQEEIGDNIVLRPNTTHTPVAIDNIAVHSLIPNPEPTHTVQSPPTINTQSSPFDTPRPTPPPPPTYEHNEPTHQSNQPFIHRQIADTPSYNEMPTPKTPPSIPHNTPRWETE
jgi:hypothetical protein